MTRFVSRVCGRVCSVLRPAAKRIPFAAPLFAGYRQVRARLVHFAKEQLCSAENLGALHALSARRFNPESVQTARSVAQPADWPFLDLSVVTCNSAQWVASFVRSLCNQHYPLERIHLYWLDQGSTDATVSALDTALQPCLHRFASVTRLQQPNVGFSAGHNRTLQTGSSPWCLVSHVDLQFSATALTTVVATALVDTRGTVASWELRQTPFEHPKYYDPVTLETNWSSHRCVLLRRAAFEQVGGYEPRLFMGTEDVELSYRFRSHGFVLKYVPSATVRQGAGEQTLQTEPDRFAGGLLGNLYVRLRYGRTKDVLVGLALYMVQLMRREPCPGARTSLLAGVPCWLRNVRHFARGKGSAPACYPLRGFDYELRRDGAFHNVLPLHITDVSGSTAGSTPTALPCVTIITRTYQGRAMFLQQAVTSVVNQTWPAIELIVVEDGGNTQEALVSTLAEQAPDTVNIRFIAQPKLGRSAVGNAGLAASTGQYLMFLDDDDLLFADHVETLMAALQADAETQAAYALAMEVTTALAPDGQSYIETSFFTPRALYQPWDHTVLQHQNFIPIQAILFRRELYEQRGGFDTRLDQLEDWHLWLRYGYRNRFRYVPKTTSLFRSPSDYTVRTARARKLHEAYDSAKASAREAFQTIDTACASAGCNNGAGQGRAPEAVDQR